MTSDAPILTLTLNPAVDVSIDAPEVADTLKIRCENPAYDPGGGGVNVARVIERLGGTAITHIAAGGGVGRLLVSLLESEGISSHVHEIAAMTRQNFAVTETSTGLQYRFVLPGAVISEREAALLFKQLFTYSSPPAAIVASGSLPPGMSPRVYADLAQHCASTKIPLALDTSGPPLEAAFGAPLWLLKVNEREISGALGMDWEAEAKRLVDHGQIEYLIVTLGEEGAMAFSRRGMFREPSPKVEIVSAVGAGDSFMAAIVLALSRDWPIRHAVRFALATGAAAVLSPATELARPLDVERLFTEMMGR